MKFEWEPKKAAGNAKRHKVGFEEATTVFADPLEVTIPDPDHSEGEARFVSIGLSAESRILIVAYTEREGTIRIIHARWPRPRNVEHMRKVKTRKTDELRAEYDFSGGVRGKHYRAYRAGTNVVVLEPDVAEAFPNTSSVNRALRALLDIAKRQTRAKRSA